MNPSQHTIQIAAALSRRGFVSAAAASLLGLAGCGGGSDSTESPQVSPLGKSKGSLKGGLDLLILTALEARDAMRARRLSAERLVSACLTQIATWEPHYNAMSWLNPLALEQARAIDRRRRRGEVLGALAGVPVVIKETMDHREAPSTLGWHRMSSSTGGVDFFPAQHAEVVQRLIAADAVIIGKGNVPAFSDDGTRAASSWAGPTYNAVTRSRAPGASSAGVATAVAAGFALLGVGEETGGSIQNPCGAQSLVGLTPSYGLVPARGVAPLAGSTRDVVGPMARTVADAALLMDVLAPGSVPAQWSALVDGAGSLAGLRLGLYGAGWRHDSMSAETQTLFVTAQQAIAQRGATLVQDPFAGSGFADLALPGEPYDFRGTESAAYDLDRYLRGLGLAGIAGLRARVGASPFEEGQPLHWYTQVLPLLQASLADPTQPIDLSEFTALRAAYRERFLSVMNTHQLDAMLLPQRLQELPGVADGVFIVESSVSALNIAGLPGLTLPAGEHASDGSPFGLILIGRPGTEAQLFAMGARLAKALPARLQARLTQP